MSIVCDVSAAAREGCRAKNGLPILIRLRKRAQEALSLVSQAKTQRRDKPDAETTVTEDDLSHLISTAKLRRVMSSPPAKKVLLKTASSGNGLVSPPPTARFSNEVLNTPSPNSTSAATSTTLVDSMLYEGAVPSFPTDTVGYGGDLVTDRSHIQGISIAEHPYHFDRLQSFQEPISPGLMTSVSNNVPWFDVISVPSYLDHDTSPSAALFPPPQDTNNNRVSYPSDPAYHSSNNPEIWQYGNAFANGGPSDLLQSRSADALDMRSLQSSSSTEEYGDSVRAAMQMGMDMDMSMALGGDLSLVLNYDEGQDIDVHSGREFDLETFLNQGGTDDWEV